MATKRGSKRYPRRNPSPLDNPAFVRWFGDSKVKVRGVPLVVYHGTPDGRGLFRDGFRRSPTRGDVFFATDNYAMAASYADAHRAWDYQNAEPGVVPLYLSIQNPLVTDWGGKVWKGTERWIERARAEGHDGLIVHNVLDYYNDNLGRGRTKPATVFAFFSSSQAKSAAAGAVPQSGIGAERGKPIQGSGPNVGAFDPSDPSITQNPRVPAAISALLPRMVVVAQKVYDEWAQDEEGYDEELGAGGICQDIADDICGVLASEGLDCSPVSASVGEQHVWVVVKLEGADAGVWSIDIPPDVYETGGGYTWRKRPGVAFEAAHIVVARESPDPSDFERFMDE